MASLTLPYSKQLQADFPELSSDRQKIRLKQVHRSGKTVYQLLYWHEGKARAPQLEASELLPAYNEANRLLASVLRGEDRPLANGVRIPPTGHIRRAEVKARKEYEKRNNSDKTFDANVRHLMRLSGWFGEYNKTLNEENLLDYIATTDQLKTERKYACAAAKMIAKVEKISLDIPKWLQYTKPAERQIRLTNDEKRLINTALKNIHLYVPDWVAWIYRVVACTGCRANNVFSMQIPEKPFNRQHDCLTYYDTKRQGSKGRVIRVEAMTMLNLSDVDPAFWWKEKQNPKLVDEDMFNVWKLYEVPQQIKEMMISGRPPTLAELGPINRKVGHAQEWFRRACEKNDLTLFSNPPECLNPNDPVPLVGFRILRKLIIAKMYELGFTEADMEKQISTSDREISRVYSSLYKNDYLTRARAVMRLAEKPRTMDELTREASIMTREMGHEMATMVQKRAIDEKEEYPPLTEKEQEMLKRFEERAKLVDQANMGGV